MLKLIKLLCESSIYPGRSGRKPVGDEDNRSVTDSPLRLVPSTPVATVTAHAGHPPTPPPTLLPVDPVTALLDPTPTHDELLVIVAGHLASSAAWAALAENDYAAGRFVDAYAAARTGYHRGLDQLRRNGWRGAGPVPWSHAPNRGWLRAVALLGRAAGALDEQDEAERCADLLTASDPEAVRALS